MAEDVVSNQVSEEDRKRANVFFEHGKVRGEAAGFDYAIEMYLQGLALDSDNVTAHQNLRDIAIKRRASGGKSLGMFDGMKLNRPSKDDRQNMLNAEKLLAFDPGNTNHMLSMMQYAHKAGFENTAMWIALLLFRANAEDKKPDYSKFISLKNLYKDLGKWREASEAAQQALQLRPDDMDLQTELKNLGAQETMAKANYAEDFTHTLKDKDSQDKMHEDGKAVRTEQSLLRAIREAEAEWKAEPNEIGKISKYVDALVRTEQMDHENRALEVLEDAYTRTNNFRFRFRMGQIGMAQMRRMERSAKAELDANPNDEGTKKHYEEFIHDQIKYELQQYQLFADNYPTDLVFRFEVAIRLFKLHQYDDAIPVFQHARTDPKLKFKAGLYLGLAFLEAGYVDESIETLRGAISDYQGRGDETSLLLFYWCARALEKKGERDDALKHYSRVAQWDFNYKDVQARIKKLRANPAAST